MSAPTTGGVPGEEAPVIATRDHALVSIELDGRDFLAHCEEGVTIAIHNSAWQGGWVKQELVSEGEGEVAA